MDLCVCVLIFLGCMFCVFGYIQDLLWGNCANQILIDFYKINPKNLHMIKDWRSDVIAFECIKFTLMTGSTK